MFFDYPTKAAVDKNVPKSKIYQHARLRTALKKKFVNEIGSIRWAYKLSPETVNLRSTESVPEIEVFVLEAKGGDISPDVIRCIDNAIPFPIIYEVSGGGRTKIVAAYKRPSEGDASKWVTDIYFETDWHVGTPERSPLPIAIDLGRLFEQILADMSPAEIRAGESLKVTAARVGEIRTLIRDASRIESRMRKEKQFNRKVELNAQLRQVRQRITELSH